jgi:hypothetical protein
MKFSAALLCAAFALFSVSVEALPYRRGNTVVFSPCQQDSDCQQGCCAFSTGKCAGPGIAQTNGDGGCGFNNPAPNCDVATVLNLGVCASGAQQGDLSSPAVIGAAQFTSQLDNIPFPGGGSASSSSPSSSSSSSSSSTSTDNDASPSTPHHKHKHSSERDGSSSSSSSSSSSAGTGSLTVFEPCTQDSDCQQGCCAFSTGKCAGPVVAQTNGDGGCGLGGSAPNCDVATILGFGGSCISGFVNGDLSNPTTIAAAHFVSNLDGIPFPNQGN